MKIACETAAVADRQENPMMRWPGPILHCVRGSSGALALAVAVAFQSTPALAFLPDTPAPKKSPKPAAERDPAPLNSEPLHPPDPHFERINNEVVADRNTGLHWTKSDNGTDINWHDAESWCSGKGRGWRLPSSNELGVLVGRPAPFRFTGSWYWTNERVDSSTAWHVSVASGKRSADVVGLVIYMRALCVRRS